MEKNETLYQKVESEAYEFFEYVAAGTMVLGGIGMLAGCIIGDKKLSDLGLYTFLLGGIWKGGAYLSENRFKPVSGLEDKIGG